MLCSKVDWQMMISYFMFDISILGSIWGNNYSSIVVVSQESTCKSIIFAIFLHSLEREPDRRGKVSAIDTNFTHFTFNTHFYSNYYYFIHGCSCLLSVVYKVRVKWLHSLWELLGDRHGKSIQQSANSNWNDPRIRSGQQWQWYQMCRMLTFGIDEFFCRND